VTAPGGLLDLASAVARDAGALLRGHFDAGHLETSSKSSPTDLVSEADLAAEIQRYALNSG